MIWFALLVLTMAVAAVFVRQHPLRLEACLAMLGALAGCTIVYYAWPDWHVWSMIAADTFLCLWFAVAYWKSVARKAAWRLATRPAAIDEPRWLVPLSTLHGAMLLVHFAQELSPIPQSGYMWAINLLVYFAIGVIVSGPAMAALNNARNHLDRPDRARSADTAKLHHRKGPP